MTRNTPIPYISEADKAYVRGLLIHEDAAVLAFDKPSGLPSQVRGNRARNLDHLLWTFARSNGKRPKLVHRLDSGTSGVIVAAKTHPAAVALSEAFASRAAQKTYFALIDLPSQISTSGIIDTPIARIKTDRGDQIIAEARPGAKQARTRWRIAKTGGGKALVELRPETGRMHQLRVHLASIGTPILGDRLYGEQRSAPRLMLHAARLELPHPDGRGSLKIEAPLPEIFEALLA